MKSAIVALIATLALPVLDQPARAQSAELDDYREVSYLVFHQKAGFDRPELSADVLEGTISITFRRLPRGWESILAPQVASERKQRFFRGFEPIVESGRTVGIRVQIGVSPFSITHYMKQRPLRWVVRVGEHRHLPDSRGPEAVPVVPYADLVETGAPGRRRLASAELRYARGDDTACADFVELLNVEGEVSSWAGLRLADCMVDKGRRDDAYVLLKAVVEADQAHAAVALATARQDEVSGKVLGRNFDRAIYEHPAHARARYGTASDELRYREARTLFFRTETAEALKVLESLALDRPRSPFFLDRSFLNVVRWRAIYDATLAGDWLLASQTYLQIPAEATDMPRWVDLHRMGAEAMRRIGLSSRAVRVYLHLLGSQDPRVPEREIILDLAEAYVETKDAYRADVTLRFFAERFPKEQRHPRAIRLRGEVAMLEGNDTGVAQAAADLTASEPAMDGERDAAFVVKAGARALDEEGLVSARRTVAPAPGAVAREARRDLAMAAGDCDALVRAVGPLAVADGRDLLFAGACLMGDGRYDEAVVMLEAARIYAPADLVDPAMAGLLEQIRQSAAWWQQHQGRLHMVSIVDPDPQS